MTRSMTIPQDERNKLTNALVRRAFVDRLQVLVEERVKISHELLDAIIGKTLLTKINAMPEGFFPITSSMRVIQTQFLGQDDVVIKFDGFPAEYEYSDRYTSTLGWLTNKISPEKKTHRRIPSSLNDGHSIYLRSLENVFNHNRDADKSLAELFAPLLEFDQKFKELRTEILSVRAQTSAIIEANKTTKKLFAAWPEIETFARKTLDLEPKAQLPANIGPLNELLDLPEEERMAAE